MLLKRVSISDKKVSEGKPSLRRVSVSGNEVSLSQPRLRRVSISSRKNESNTPRLRRVAITDVQCLPCDSSERTLAYMLKVIFPEGSVPDRGFKECCYDNLVLADTSGDRDKNDFNSFFFKKQSSLDSCDFILVDTKSLMEYDLDDSTYGNFFDFGDHLSQQDLTTYKVEWSKVLAVLGTGFYQVKKIISIAGVPFERLSNTFHLEVFSNDLADKTVRIDTVMDGRLIHYGVDFKGTGFTTSMRMGGFFGRANPTYVQDNLVKRNYEKVQISMSKEDEYQFQTNILPVCITKEFYDFILFGNQIYISDYNKNNHSYEYVVFPVELDSNKGAGYYVESRDSKINLTFKDRFNNKRKLNC